MSLRNEDDLQQQYFSGPEAAHGRALHAPHFGQRYTLGKRVFQAVIAAHRPHRGEPPSRPLRIFAIDPAASVLEGKMATADVPYEPLQPGPCGALIEVINEDGHSGEVYPPVDLDEQGVLLSAGHSPSDSDPRFHAQMVYAVASIVHARFRRALGRQIGWPFGRGGVAPRLRILPFGGLTENAVYEPDTGTLRFGYFPAGDKPADRTLPQGIVYTVLSHDIVAHEMSHAMLDCLRSNFQYPTSNDMTGFHEGFADLVALFLHFRHRDALRCAIATSRGDVREAPYLTSIGQQFGKANRPTALRIAVASPEDLSYTNDLPAHEMGRVLIAAVFDAFATVYERKTARYRRLASGGTGRLPDGALPDLLVDVLTDKAADLAEQFLTVLIRAVDYLPPCDVRLGEYLRAIVTADTELEPVDKWGYREALIDAFRLRKIYPRHVRSLNEDSLMWRPPTLPMPSVQALSFHEIRFSGDPGLPMWIGEQIVQACALGEYLTESAERMTQFGISAPDDPKLGGDAVSLPRIESVRTMRRTCPDGRVAFDTVAEVLQTRRVRPKDGRSGLDIFGGSTIVLDSTGAVRYVVPKCVTGEGRVERRLAFAASGNGKAFWAVQGEYFQLKSSSPFFALCDRSKPA